MEITVLRWSTRHQAGSSLWAILTATSPIFPEPVLEPSAPSPCFEAYIEPLRSLGKSR